MDLKRILFLAFAYRASANMLQTSVPLYARYTLKLSDGATSILVTLSNVIAVFSFLLLISFRRDLKKALCVCFLLMCAGTSLILFARSFLALFLCFALANLGSAPLQSLLFTSTVFASKKETSFKNVSLFTSALSLSLVLGPLYQALVLRLFQNNLLLSMLSFLPFTLCALIVCLFTHLHTTASFEFGKIDFLRDKAYITALLVEAMYALPFVALLTFGGIFLKERFSVSLSLVELLYSLLTRFALSKFAQKRFALVTFSTFLTIFSLVALSFSQNLFITSFLFVLLGFPHGVTYPLSSSYVAESVKKERLTFASSLSQSFFGVTSFLAIPFVGYVGEIFGLGFAFLLLTPFIFALYLGFSLLNS
ncbi:hypothetical protein B9Q13_00905 [Candidatus Marsarchaeota G2 archaeon ECH_B_SAG-G16]|uniref:Major facilitator superfamily (MFS) profile domain-containing protein n=1 Tax=Candidatus Marsarchaeota G2 archaeon ECH_B_SAG-G16 TaxID=1978167 RepID=A0A2R6C4D4_9ARCH|nr:MAG: hypothetical protein B9Q13_00905 [Candidatus Marsarchaeota G2 archaeon ECH_B_SAG-G16]